MGNEDQHHADYSNFSTTNKEEVLQQIVDSYTALRTENWVCNLANASSLLWHAYHSMNVPVNWTGFYVIDPQNNQGLILGPFQGKVACQTIAFGRGVCGACASYKETQLVPDVEKFPGHIACDGETKSEIVVPIMDSNGVLRGVIDLDCLALNGFDTVDKKYLEELAKLIGECPNW